VTVLLLALEAAIYPTLMAAVIVLLRQPRRGRLLAAYLGGGLLISISLGLAIVAALHQSHAVQTSSSTLGWTADLVIGAGSLLVALALARHADQRLLARRRARRPVTPPDPGHEPWSQRILAHGNTPIVFVAGLIVNVPGAAYLIALKDIAAGGHSTGGVIAWVLVFNLIMFLLAEIPLAGLVFAPDRTDALVAGMNRWLSEHSRVLAIVICVALGVFLVVRGLVRAI
jgi:hypothetical protein